MAKSSPTLTLTTQIRLRGKQPILQEMIKTSWSRTITSSQKVSKYKRKKFPFNAIRGLASAPKPVLLTVRGMTRLSHTLFNVFSWPLCYLFLWGVELKGSTTTRQALAQCVLRGQEGRYSSACWGGFLRTSTHWEFSITLWLHTRIRKRTIQSCGTRKKRKQLPNNWPTEKVLKPLLYRCSMTALTLSSGFPSALPVTQAATFIYRNWPAAKKIPCILHTLFKGCNDQLWLIIWRARVRDRLQKKDNRQQVYDWVNVQS